MTDTPKAGDVLRYPYLWARQADVGETEGRKPRPCAVVLAITARPGKTELRLCAVTTQPPQPNTRAIPVPDTEKRRAGLDAHIPLWVIIDEHNVDVFEQSYYIEPRGQLGVFSAAFTKELQRNMIAVLQDRAGRTIKRSDR
jgi:hypothetical protein